ncbi:MAG: hypothetical protein OXF11_14570 [Deltaproteobacteria bacterium]|nr:hypothetical protein [Deltaproteobacteria bacterium]
MKIREIPNFIAQKLGPQRSITESTYRRAIRGRPLFIGNARNISEVFGLPFEELVVSRQIQPMLADVEAFLDAVREIIRTWLNEGYDDVNGQLPLHPEFVYRLSGDWTGWNQFRRLPPDHPQWKENLSRDIIEQSAFQIVESMAELELCSEPVAADQADPSKEPPPEDGERPGQSGQ